MAIPSFVDQVTLHVSGGNGGHGVASVHREKFKPLGGPDGGNGGHGGDVILVVSPDVTTLIDYHHEPHRKGTNGAPGAGNNRSGGQGEDLVLLVPDGTVVRDESGEVLADLLVIDDQPFNQILVLCCYPGRAGILITFQCLYASERHHHGPDGQRQRDEEIGAARQGRGVRQC